MIHYVKGNALEPIGEGLKVIIHCCNNIKKWGSGFVVEISKKWKAPENFYRQHQSMELGTCAFVPVEEDLIVCNMIGQRGIKHKNNPHPIEYPSLGLCLQEVNKFCEENNATIHGPRFGADRAGGKWDLIELIIQANIPNIPVTIYSLK